MKNKNSHSKLKSNINNKFKRFKQHKLYLSFVIIIILSFIFGLLFLALLSTENKEMIKESLDQFFLLVGSNDLNYFSALLNSLRNSVGVNLLIWILGISIIGIPIILLISLFKSFTLGFTLSSIVYFYGIRGGVIGIIYILPGLVILFIYLITSVVAISFSRHLFNMIIRRKEVVFKTISRRYVKLLGLSTAALILCSLIEIYLIPFILRTIIA